MKSILQPWRQLTTELQGLWGCERRGQTVQVTEPAKLNRMFLALSFKVNTAYPCQSETLVPEPYQLWVGNRWSDRYLSNLQVQHCSSLLRMNVHHFNHRGLPVWCKLKHCARRALSAMSRMMDSMCVGHHVFYRHLYLELERLRIVYVLQMQHQF